MPRFRDIVATELANQQIHHNHFLARPERSSIDTKSAGNSSKRSHIENACSDSDIRKPGTKRKKIKQLRGPLADITQDSTNIVELAWKDLDVSLRNVLPDMEGVTYVVSELSSLPQENFSGAPSYAF